MEGSVSTRAAKEFLIRCITDEAQRESVPLSDTERDMLYFSETAWTLPNMAAINEAFDRDYDQSAYEAKISALIRNFKARGTKDDHAALETWNDSVHVLQSEDHYILVMTEIANDDQLGPLARTLKLLTIGVVAGITALLITFVILFIARR